MPKTTTGLAHQPGLGPTWRILCLPQRMSPVLGDVALWRGLWLSQLGFQGQLPPSHPFDLEHDLPQAPLAHL